LLSAIKEVEREKSKKDSDVSLVSEEAGAWKLLQEQILELAQKRTKSSADKPHWAMIRSTIN
jgi:hypothetical protein